MLWGFGKGDLKGTGTTKGKQWVFLGSLGGIGRDWATVSSSSRKVYSAGRLRRAMVSSSRWGARRAS